MVEFPALGQNWATKIHFSRDNVLDALCDRNTLYELLPALNQVTLDMDSAEYIQPMENDLETRRIGIPRTDEYLDNIEEATPQDRAQLGLMAHILARPFSFCFPNF